MSSVPRALRAWMLAGAALSWPVVLADQGRIPIFEPITITDPGDYVVTRDFTSPGDAITIQVSNVTVDLNGHTITGPGGCGAGGDLISIDNTTATDGLVIRNGRLLNGCSGIYANGFNRMRIRIEDLEVGGAADTGIQILAAETVDIERCHVHDGAQSGMQILGSVGAFTGKIVGNIIERVALEGIDVNGLTSGEIRDNQVIDFGSEAPNLVGIHLEADLSSWAAGGNVVQGNTVSSLPSGTDDDGIVLEIFSPDNLLVGNVVHKNGRYGIWSRTDETRLERNIASRNGSHGIRIGDGPFGTRNHLEWNQAQGNNAAGSCGVSFDNGGTHIYRNNTVRNNAVAGFCGTANTDGGGNIP